MGLRLAPASEIPAADERWAEATAGVWPEYNTHGDVVSRLWDGLSDRFAPFQFVLVDDASGALAARGHTIPCRWDGRIENLPAGIDGAIEQGFALADAGEPPTALSALAIAVAPPYQRRGLAALMIRRMRELAREHGLQWLIAPLRPTWKERYPLTPIERYAAWTRDDGAPFDPWIRLHVRLGAEILRPEPRSLRITARVASWEEWTGLRFPESGEYVFPQGLAPLDIDVDADIGRYWEPNVWVAHRPG